MIASKACLAAIVPPTVEVRLRLLESESLDCSTFPGFGEESRLKKIESS